MVILHHTNDVNLYLHSYPTIRLLFFPAVQFYHIPFTTFLKGFLHGILSQRPSLQLIYSYPPLPSLLPDPHPSWVTVSDLGRSEVSTGSKFQGTITSKRDDWKTNLNSLVKSKKYLVYMCTCTYIDERTRGQVVLFS